MAFAAEAVVHTPTKKLSRQNLEQTGYMCQNRKSFLAYLRLTANSPPLLYFPRSSPQEVFHVWPLVNPKVSQTPRRGHRRKWTFSICMYVARLKLRSIILWPFPICSFFPFSPPPLTCPWTLACEDSMYQQPIQVQHQQLWYSSTSGNMPTKTL